MGVRAEARVGGGRAGAPAVCVRVCRRVASAPALAEGRRHPLQGRAGQGRVRAGKCMFTCACRGEDALVEGRPLHAEDLSKGQAGRWWQREGRGRRDRRMLRREGGGRGRMDQEGGGGEGRFRRREATPRCMRRHARAAAHLSNTPTRAKSTPEAICYRGSQPRRRTSPSWPLKECSRPPILRRSQSATSESAPPVRSRCSE